MFGILWQVSSVLAAAALLTIGTSLLSIILPLSLARAEVSTELTGIVMAAYYAGLMFGARYGIAIITRIGHIRAFAGFAAICCAAVLSHPLWVDPLPWIVLRLISGFCLAGLFATMESWLNDITNNQTRGRVLGVYLMTSYIAAAIGQLMVNVWDVWQVYPYLVAGLIVSLSLVPVVLTRVMAPDITQVTPLSLRRLLHISPLAVVGTFCSGLLMGAFYGLGAVYGQLIQLDVFGISIFLAGLVLGGFLLQFPIGKLSDVLDRRTVMAVVMAVAVVLSVVGALLPSFTGNIWAYVAIAALVGGPFSVVYPLALGQAFDYLPKDSYVAASGGLLLSYAIGATLGPIVCSFLIGQVGSIAFFGFFAVVCLLLCGFVILRMRARTALPASEQEVYQAVPVNSPIAAELDPRGPEETGGGAGPEAGADTAVGAGVP